MSVFKSFIIVLAVVFSFTFTLSFVDSHEKDQFYLNGQYVGTAYVFNTNGQNCSIPPSAGLEYAYSYMDKN